MSGSLSALFALLPLLPAIYAWTPAARWGHDAIYVKDQDSMYVIGGQVQTPGTQVTNDVLILPLNGTNPSWIVGPSTNLPPHAFASSTITSDGSSLVVIGGMTHNCDSDSIAHTLNLHGDGSWVHANPTGLVRRRGAGLGVVNDYSAQGKLLLVGGVADQYSCAAYTTTFPATNTLTLPLSNSSVDSTRDLPGNLTGTTLAVSDFAMTSSPDGNKMYLISGQSSSGQLAGLDNIGVWTNSGGWANQKVGGNIPVGRVGATLVAHPTLDLLVLHGGARDDRGTDLSTTLLALLNTTSWQWTIPPSLQPPQSAAASYHSSIMTPTGVMISAFGLSNTGTPRSDIHYLDMRDPSQASWTWKSAWKGDMLQAYVTPSTESTQTNGGAAAGAAPASAAMGAPSRNIASIVAPVVIFGVIGVALIVFFVRRKMRIARKRRMARHFSFSLQEDGGDFRTPLTGSGSGRLGRGRNLYPFGGKDMNEKDTTFLQDIQGRVGGIVDRIRGRSNPADREMRQVHKVGGKGGKYNEKSMKWEEIDFGLGQVDSRRGSAVGVGFEPSSRRSSFSATGSPPETARYVDTVPMPVAMPMASGVNYNGQMFNLPGATEMPAPLLVTISAPPAHSDDSPRVGTPSWDGQQPLIPSLVIMPPTVPPTPAVPADGMPEPVFPIMSPSSSPVSATPPRRPERTGNDAGLDWSQLEQELDSRPAFRSISPTSPLRSHQASHQVPVTPPRINTHTGTNANPFSDRHAASPRSASPISPIAPLRSQTPPNGNGNVITYVNPKTGRRTSETSLTGPLTPPHQINQSPRSVSSPIAGRQLAGNFERRGSAPQFYTAPNSPAGSSPGATPVISTAVRFDPTARRGSIPTVLVSSPMARTGSAGASTGTVGSLGDRRGSQLRVCNATDEELSPGQAM